ncbi:MAG: Fe-S cluster assembly protein SufD [Gammaproteobacteria bacterium]|nr:Fe-S cluster assembly protein SufD [Gammaproteobacteria bacterium]
MANKQIIKDLVNSNDLEYFSSINEENTWLNGYNKESYLKLLERTIPSINNEEWRYTKITDALNQYFLKAKENKTLPNNFKTNKYDNNEDFCIYFSNGVYYHHGKLPPYINTLKISKNHTHFEDKIYNSNKVNDCLINDLNTILLSDMISIETKSNQKIDNVIRIINLSHKDSVLCPRVSINLASNSSLKIFEHHQTQESSVLNNSIDIHLDKDSTLDYFRIIDKQVQSHDLTSQRIKIGENSSVNLFSLDSGADTSRSNIDVALEGDNSAITINGLYTPSENLHSGNQLKINHIANKTKSSLDFRGILDDQSAGVFFGKVKVDKTSSQTIANMSNHNLLLSEYAKVSSKPILEIYNDDVECSHSSTSGNLDDDKIFYIKSRGIDEKSAKAFLVQSFAAKIINKITNTNMRQIFNTHLLHSLKIN